MTPVFADTHFFLALVNARDESHARAAEWARTARQPAITTQWVLAEVGNALREPENRRAFLSLLDSLRGQSDVEIVAASAESFEQGVALFADRPDKGWSMVDCISFALMAERKLREALTSDHHFEQAGFQALLK
jgi:predicted nucleic acid-binding protein